MMKPEIYLPINAIMEIREAKFISPIAPEWEVPGLNGFFINEVRGDGYLRALFREAGDDRCTCGKGEVMGQTLTQIENKEPVYCTNCFGRICKEKKDEAS